MKIYSLVMGGRHVSYLFSVLIPVYNTENYIRECIESILKQTYQNFEVILIDDGSTDSSAKICDEYANKDFRIRAFHQGNQGLVMSRRTAIHKATGDFCIFMDSDDYWDYNLLELVNKTIAEYDSDMVIFKAKIVSEEGVFIAETNSVFNDNTVITSSNKERAFKKLISSSKLNNLWNKVVKREIIDDMDYKQYSYLRMSEDLLQSLPLLYNAKKIIYLDKALYNYRIRSGSITHSFDENLYRDITTVREIVLQYLKRLNMDNLENLQLFHQNYMSLILNYFSKLINSDLAKKEKLDILLKIHKIPLYIDSLEYIDTSELSLKKKIQFYTFNKRYYGLLFCFENTVGLIKVLRDFIFNRRGGSSKNA